MAVPTANPFDRFGESLEKLAKVTAAAQTGLATMFSSLERSLNSLGTQFTRFVQLPNPAAVIRFNLALKDTQAVIGQILTPVLEKFTRLVRQVGDAIINLDAKTKQLLGGLAIGAGLAGAFAGLAAAASVLFRVIGRGPLLLASLVAGLAGASQVVAALAPLGDAFEKLVVAVGGALKPLMDGLISVLVPVIEVVAGVLKVAAEVFAALFRVLTPLAEVVRELLYLVGSLLEGFVKLAGEIGGELIRLITDGLTGAIEAFSNAVRDLVAFLRRQVNALRELIGLDPIQDAPAPEKRKSSTGAAVRNANIGSVQELINAAYKSAFQGGPSVDVAKKQLGLVGMIEKHVADIARRVADSGERSAPQPVQESAIGDVRQDQSRRFD